MNRSVTSHTFFLIAFLALSFTAKTSPAATATSPSKEEADKATRLYLFAEELYQTGQYYRALTEYQRFGSYYKGHEMSENVMFKIGLCYFRGKKYKEGAVAFEKMNSQYPDTTLGKEAMLMAGECYRKRGFMRMAIDKFSQLAENSIKEETTVKAVYAMGLIYSDNGKLKEAKEHFQRLGENPSYVELSERTVKDIEKHMVAKRKNPTTAGVLAIIPGLGHLYCERSGDALVSFLINGLFIWGAVESFRQEQFVVGGILAFFELGWYTGNIHSAIGSAYKYNRYQEKMFQERLEKNVDLAASPTPSTPYLTISFDIPF